VTVSTNDGVNTASTAFTWHVTVETPPTVTNPGSLFNHEGDVVHRTIVASDADGDPLTYSATGLPTGLTIDPSTGLITGSISYSAAQGERIPDRLNYSQVLEEV
jgi:hypothetical protein